MSFDVKEGISSLLDGELDTVERKKVIDSIKNDGTHQETWARYCMIGQALKRNLPPSPTQDLFSRIQSSIDAEPALLSPSPTSVDSSVTKVADVVELPKKTEQIKPKESKPAFGFAVAASIALATVLGFQFLNTTEDTGMGLPVASQQAISPSQEITVVTHSRETLSSPKVDVEEPLYAEQSVINDGQWTRITHIGNLQLNGKLVGQRAEAHANVSIQGKAIPFTRPVNLDNSSAQ